MENQVFRSQESAWRTKYSGVRSQESGVRSQNGEPQNHRTTELRKPSPLAPLPVGEGLGVRESATNTYRPQPWHDQRALMGRRHSLNKI